MTQTPTPHDVYLAGTGRMKAMPPAAQTILLFDRQHQPRPELLTTMPEEDPPSATDVSPSRGPPQPGQTVLTLARRRTGLLSPQKGR
jgi:hypothetical protein